MSYAPWRQEPLPEPGPDATTLGRWTPRGSAELAAGRLRLAAALHDGARPARADEAAVQKLILAFEELVSNALRHGRPPVTVSVTATDHYWLLQVNDAAGDRPPTAAVGRDAAQGGLGLYLVAELRRPRLARRRRRRQNGVGAHSFPRAPRCDGHLGRTASTARRALSTVRHRLHSRVVAGSVQSEATRFAARQPAVGA